MNLIKVKFLLPFILVCSLTFLAGLLFCLEFSSLERVLLPYSISILLSLGIFVILNNIFKDKFISKIYLISVLFHFIIILFWQIFKYYILGYNLPSDNTFIPFTVDNDGVLYHQLGVHISNNFSFELLKEKFTGGLFPKIIGVLYHYFGNNPFIPCCLNCIIAGFTAIFIYLIGKNTLKDIITTKLYTIFSIVTFSHLLNTSVLMRDGYITLFMYSSLFLSYLFYKTSNLLYLLLTILSCYGLYLFRPYAAFVIIFAIIATQIFIRLKLSFTNKKLKLNKITAIFLILSPIIMGIIIFALLKISSFMSVISVEDLITIRDVSYVGGDSDMGMDFGALYSKFFLLPFIIGYFCLFFAPFPWEWIKPSRIIYVPDMLILYCFLPSFFKNIKKVFTDKNYFLIICFCSMIFMFSIYCITLGNSGAIHRLRGPFIPMIYLIAMYRPDKFLSRILNKIQKWRLW